jgi:hypothetical protein
LKNEFDKVLFLPRRGDPTALRRIAETGIPDSDPTVVEALLDLAQGNYGGMNVVTQLVKAERADVLEQIKKKNMRGEHIWVGFKDACEYDLNAFAKAVLTWDPKMLKIINKRCEDPIK